MSRILRFLLLFFIGVPTEAYPAILTIQISAQLRLFFHTALLSIEFKEKSGFFGRV